MDGIRCDIAIGFGQLGKIIARENISDDLIDEKELAKYIVDNETISENDYNIAVSSYVEQKDTREVIDIKVLNAQIAETVKRQDALRKAIDDIVNDLEVDNNG